MGIALVVAAAAALALLAGSASRRFRAEVGNEARALWSTAATRGAPVDRAYLASLPPPVRRYLELAIGDRAEAITAVRLRHGGTMTTAPGRAATPIRGVQYFAADPPGFVWWGRIRLAPGVWVDARDRSARGRGSMKIRALSAFAMGDAAGPEIDQGALLRLLGEMLWFPTAFLDRSHVTWEPIDEHHARVTARVGGAEASAVYTFGDDGLPVRFEAMRYQSGRPGGPIPWRGDSADWRRVEGVLVPFRMEATWLQPEGEYTYARFQVEALELERPEPYRD